MGQADYLLLGDWNAVCFRCGKKFKASTLKKTWEGFYACITCWEPRQPQDFVRAVDDNPAAPWVQPPTNLFILVCTPQGRAATPGYGVIGCAVVGVPFNWFGV